MKPTCKIILDKRRKKIGDTYPLKLRVTYNRQSKLYGFDLEVTEDDWKKLKADKFRNEKLKEAKYKMNLFLNTAEQLIKDIPQFSFQGFEKMLNPIIKDKQDVLEHFNVYIGKLEKEGRVGTAISYKNASVSLTKFKKSLKLSDITADFLQDYEKWFLNQGNSLTTVGIYLRALRAIFNDAISEGFVKMEQYPFGKKKYVIPSGKNIKKALYIEDIEKIFNYEVFPKSGEEQAKDLWLFSYLCNGINMMDICKLKWQDISGNKIFLHRTKTIRTSKANAQPISIVLRPEALDIINRYNKEPKASNYVFPFLKDGLTPQRQKELVNNVTKTTNKFMKRIGKELEFSKPLTMYVARHSFSTILKRAGASTDLISDMLGHSNINTTQKYLGSFEDSVLEDFSEKLLSFKK